MNLEQLRQYIIDNKITIKDLEEIPEGWSKVINYFNGEPDTYELHNINGDILYYPSTLMHGVNISSPLPEDYIDDLPQHLSNKYQIEYIEPLRKSGKLSANNAYFMNLDAYEENKNCTVRSGFKYQFKFLLKEDADKFIELFHGHYVV